MRHDAAIKSISDKLNVADEIAVTILMRGSKAD